MANFKKMDDKDFVFINRSLTEKEKNEFSDFLKAFKEKASAKVKHRRRTRSKKQRV